MAEVHVLVTGYVKEGEGTEEKIPAFLGGHGALFVQPTVTLVRDGNILMIVGNCSTPSFSGNPSY